MVVTYVEVLLGKSLNTDLARLKMGVHAKWNYPKTW
jgi:hypothetical protein